MTKNEFSSALKIGSGKAVLFLKNNQYNNYDKTIIKELSRFTFLSYNKCDFNEEYFAEIINLAADKDKTLDSLFFKLNKLKNINNKNKLYASVKLFRTLCFFAERDEYVDCLKNVFKNQVELTVKKYGKKNFNSDFVIMTFPQFVLSSENNGIFAFKLMKSHWQQCRSFCAEDFLFESSPDKIKELLKNLSDRDAELVPFLKFVKPKNKDTKAKDLKAEDKISSEKVTPLNEVETQNEETDPIPEVPSIDNLLLLSDSDCLEIIEETDDIISEFKKTHNKFAYADAAVFFLKVMEKVNNYNFEVLKFLLSTVPCPSIRQRIVEILIKTNSLDDELKESLKYDCNYDIRNLIK